MTVTAISCMLVNLAMVFVCLADGTSADAYVAANIVILALGANK